MQINASAASTIAAAFQAQQARQPHRQPEHRHIDSQEQTRTDAATAAPAVTGPGKPDQQTVKTGNQPSSPTGPTASHTPSNTVGKDEATARREEQQIVRALQARDREVRTHEAAHKAAAGRYATGAPSYSYERGPDGRLYAVGGEVGIDTSPVPGDPEATLRKANTIRAAATAPAEPSGQDYAVAAQAAAMAAEARQEIFETRQQQDDTEPTPDHGAPFSNGNKSEARQYQTIEEISTASEEQRDQPILDLRA